MTDFLAQVTAFGCDVVAIDNRSSVSNLKVAPVYIRLAERPARN